MAEKKGLGLMGTTNITSKGLPPKEKVKSSTIDVDTINETAKSIHKSNTKMVRLSLDVSPEMYDKIKRKQLDKGIKTTREYLVQLVTQDIE